MGVCGFWGVDTCTRLSDALEELKNRQLLDDGHVKLDETFSGISLSIIKN